MHREEGSCGSHKCAAHALNWALDSLSDCPSGTFQRRTEAPLASLPDYGLHKGNKHPLTTTDPSKTTQALGTKGSPKQFPILPTENHDDGLDTSKAKSGNYDTPI